MADPARPLDIDHHKEYWRPANPSVARVIAPLTQEKLCPHCGVEYLIGARFCHVCGATFDEQTLGKEHFSLGKLLDIDHLRRKLGLSIASMVFFIGALTCLIGALLTGIVYRPGTVLAWEAVQMWRIEWLLAGIGAILIAILLRK